MILVKNLTALSSILAVYSSARKQIGFVPTMGALHAGHISLIEQAESENDLSVCSIFVNPAQFNNNADFVKYPVTIESDIDKLEKAGCSMLFMPSITEIYPPGEKPVHYELGYLETVLEGKYRPGHFQGVCRVVDKLIDFVKPDVMYLGRKDYQQCMVIKKMMQLRKYETALRICETVREPDGLAMSSRNLRLNEAERETAVKIIESLRLMKKSFLPGDISGIKNEAVSFLKNNGFKTDYAEIADAETLELMNEWDGKKKAVALVAAYLNEIRLIDNIDL